MVALPDTLHEKLNNVVMICLKEETGDDNEDDMGSSSEMDTSLDDTTATDSSSEGNSDEESDESLYESTQSLNESLNDEDEQVCCSRKVYFIYRWLYGFTIYMIILLNVYF